MGTQSLGKGGSVGPSVTLALSSCLHGSAPKGGKTATEAGAFAAAVQPRISTDVQTPTARADSSSDLLGRGVCVMVCQCFIRLDYEQATLKD